MQIDEWPANMPMPGTPPRITAEPAPAWETWVAAGRRIAWLESSLVQALAGDPDEFRRAGAAVALGFLCRDVGVTSLVSARRHDLPSLAVEAAATLGRPASAEAMEPLCVALGSADINVRANAATALSSFADERARPCLEWAGRDPSPFVHATAQAARRDG